MSQMMRSSGGCFALGALLIAATAVFPQSAAAQGVEEEKTGGLELTGYIGLITPLARLADQGDTVTAELSTKVSFAAELDYWLESGLGFSAYGFYSRPELTVQIFESDVGFPTPLQLGATNYLAATANVMYRPNLGGAAAVLLPYFGLGAGVVSVGYPDVGDVVIQDESRFAGSIFGGAHIRFSGRWFVRLDLRNFTSKFDTEPFESSKLQNDFTSSVGVGVRFD
jgi:hypothetical protein